MRISLCPICSVVSGSWLVLSAGVAWGYLRPETFLIPISLLMGGTVVGIAYRSGWKRTGVLLGMPLAYILVVNLSKLVVGIESILLILTAYLLFVRPSVKPAGTKDTRDVREIEEQMKSCC